MTNPVYAYKVRGRGRCYPWPAKDLTDLSVDGRGSIKAEDVPEDVALLPSVTNVLGIKHKDLTWWASVKALESAYADPKTILLDHASEDEVEAWVKEHAGASNRRRDERADEGSIGHDEIDKLLTGQPYDEHNPFVKAFKDFQSTYRFDVEWTERTVCHPEWGYAGTADLLGFFKHPQRGLTVVDWKTKSGERPKTKNGKYRAIKVYDSQVLQVAALANATHLLDTGEELPLVMWGAVVWLYESGEHYIQWVPPEQLEAGAKAFKGLLSVWKWTKGLEL